MTYNEFIQNIINTRGQWNIPEGEYYEVHHILPKCLGGLPNYYDHHMRHENLIWLLPEEHFEAHRLLAIENPHNKKLVFGFWAMCTVINTETQTRYKVTAEEYAELRKTIQQFDYSDVAAKTSAALLERYANGTLTNWNKGLTAETNESLKKHSKFMSDYIKIHGNPANRVRDKEADSRHKSEGHKKYYELQANRDRQAKKVYCIELDMIFDSATSACIYLGKPKKSNYLIRAYCNGKCKKPPFGYHWKYIEK